MEKNKWSVMAEFYQKQLQDRAGIISRSADLDPDNPEWLVQSIEQKLNEALAKAKTN
jgi:hypothetical protein